MGKFFFIMRGSLFLFYAPAAFKAGETKVLEGSIWSTLTLRFVRVLHFTTSFNDDNVRFMAQENRGSTGQPGAEVGEAERG